MLLINQMTNKDGHIFHLTKVGGEIEMRKMYKQSDIQVEDYLGGYQEFGFPLKPCYIPQIFMFLSEEETFESGLCLLYAKDFINYTANDFQKRYNN